LKAGYGREEQKALLLGEGIEFNDSNCIDLERFRWDWPA
jgi:alkylated DNA nucleotide flippase Atl1